jgi:hypothetical protein
MAMVNLCFLANNFISYIIIFIKINLYDRPTDLLIHTDHRTIKNNTVGQKTHKNI